MKRRVVVTGIGPITSIGIGKRDFFDRLLACETNVKEIPAAYEARCRFKSRYYTPFPDFRLPDEVETKYENVMEKTSQIAVAATHLALRDAGLKDVERASVILGVGISTLKTAFQSHLAHLGEHTAARFNRMIIPMMMTNAAAAWVSILFGIKGPAWTLNAACASGTCAIGEAYRKIADGYCDTAIAGGVECLEDSSGSTMRGFDALGALTTSPDGIPRPFSTERSGFLFSEGGGCVLVLEEFEHARRRVARVYAEIAGYAMNSDAHNIVRMEDSGVSIDALLEDLLDGCRPAYFNAHGTGTPMNDQIEAAAIRRLFGDAAHQPLINSTKGFIGHTIGASGAIEAAVAALSIHEGKIHGNILGEPMPDLNLVKETVEMPIESAVSVSFGFGGHNAALFLTKPDLRESLTGRLS